MKKTVKPAVLALPAALALLGACGGADSVTGASAQARSASMLRTVPAAAGASVESAGQPYRASEAFVSGGATSDGNSVAGFTTVGARAIFTVRVPSAGNYTLNLNYANGNSGARSLNVYVNGLWVAKATLTPSGGGATWASNGSTVALHAGLNTITYRNDPGMTGDVALRYVGVVNGQPMEVRGASLPYQEYEAEAGVTNGAQAGPSTEFRIAEGQSSGRRFVSLNQTGHYVEWTATKQANTVVVRYSIPDAPNGGGANATLGLYINGSRARTINLSSKYAWNYGAFPYSDNPADGQSNHFYDETRVLGVNIPAGAKVRLQRDSGDTAAYYKIDLVDLEQIEAAYTKPANFLDIRDYGAVANDDNDDMAAIVNTINAARSQGKGVWIPQGYFVMSGRPELADVQVRGAGMWYTEVHGVGGKGGFMGNGNNITVADLTLTSDSLRRKDADDNPGLEGNFGTNSLIQNVWVEHMKVGMWLGSNNDGLYIVSGRVRDTWADGVNFSGGVRNSTVSHFNFRNTGDDCMAMWSNGRANVNDTFRFNTAQVPVLANNFAIYGGQDNKILDNNGNDTVLSGAGIQVSTRFGATPFAGTTQVRRNTLNRTGSYDTNWSTSFGALWLYAEGQAINAPLVVDTVDVNDSPYDGVLMSYNQNIGSLTMSDVRINKTGNYGLDMVVTGKGTFSNVTVSGAGSGGLNNAQGFNIVRGSGNSGW